MSEFAAAETISASDIREGDFIEIVPTQHNVRGLRVQSIVEVIDDDMTTWRRNRKRVPSLVFMTMRKQRINIPASFDVVVRRAI